MNSHLVPVKIRVVSGTDERVDPDRLSLDEHRFKSLDREPVQGRSTIQQNGMTLRDFVQDIPDLWCLAFDHLLGAAYRVDVTKLLQSSNDERLEQNKSHFLRQPALVELELRTDDDNGAARIVHAFPEQVLAEAAAFAFQHVAKRFQRPVPGARYRAPMAAIVKQRIDGFLQHPLLIPDDDVRCFQ